MGTDLKKQQLGELAGKEIRELKLKDSTD